MACLPRSWPRLVPSLLLSRHPPPPPPPPPPRQSAVIWSQSKESHIITLWAWEFRVQGFRVWASQSKESHIITLELKSAMSNRLQ